MLTSPRPRGLAFSGRLCLLDALRSLSLGFTGPQSCLLSFTKEVLREHN